MLPSGSHRTRLRPWVHCLLLPLLVAAPPLLGQGASECSPEPFDGTALAAAPPLSIASGEEGGLYHEVALSLRQELQRLGAAESSLSVVPTRGSYDNAKAVAAGGAQLAIVQSDAAYLTHFESRNLRSLAVLFDEPIHALALRRYSLDRVGDLGRDPDVQGRRLRVYPGPRGSGSRSHALTLLESIDPPLKLNLSDRRSTQEDYEAAVEEMEQQKIDLLFRTSRAPDPQLARLLNQGQVSLLRIDGSLRRRLLRDNPFLVPSKILFDDYGDEGTRSIRTLATPALLVSNRDLPDVQVRAVLTALCRIAERRERRAELAGNTPEGRRSTLRRFRPEAGVPRTAIPLHPVAQDWYRQQPNRFLRFLHRYRSKVPAFVLGGLAALLVLILVQSWMRETLTAVGRLVVRSRILWLFPLLAALFLGVHWLALPAGVLAPLVVGFPAWIGSWIGDAAALAFFTALSLGILVAALLLEGVFLLRLVLGGRGLWNRIFRLGSSLALLSLVILSLALGWLQALLASIWFQLLLACLPLVALLSLLSRRVRAWASQSIYLVHQSLLGTLAAWLISIWLIGSSLMYVFEGETNRAFATYADSMVAIFHYLFSGLKASAPQTWQGDLVALGLLTFGAAVVAMFTGAVVERFINIGQLRRKPPFLPGLKGHVVIVGWTARVRRILNQLRQPDLDEEPLVVIVTAHPEKLRVDRPREFRRAWLVEGDICDADILAKANVADARVTLLPREPKATHPDVLAIQRSLAVQRLEARKDHRTHLVTELETNHWRERLAEHWNALGTTAGGNGHEEIVTRKLSYNLLAQCATTPGISRLFEEIFSFGAGSQEIHLQAPTRFGRPLSFDGWTGFLDLHDLIPIGYHSTERKEADLNPARDADPQTDRALGDPGASGYRLSDRGDRLVFLADQPREIRRLLPRWPIHRLYAAHRRRRARGDSTPTRQEVMEWWEGSTQRWTAERPLRVWIWGEEESRRAFVDILQRSASVAWEIHQFDAAKEGADPGAEGGLEARLETALRDGQPPERLVILADRTSAPREEADQRTFERALDADALRRRLCAEMDPGTRGIAEMRIVVEVRCSASRKHFHRLPRVEVVAVEDLCEKLLAQAAVTPGITRIFQQLLALQEGTPQVAVKHLPAGWQGCTFDQIRKAVLATDVALLPIGYRSRGQDGVPRIVLNPPLFEGSWRRRLALRKLPPPEVERWRFHRMGADDALILLADRQPRYGESDRTG